MPAKDAGAKRRAGARRYTDAGLQAGTRLTADAVPDADAIPPTDARPDAGAFPQATAELPAYASLSAYATSLPPHATGLSDYASPPVWCVYLVECADGTYYCGVTSNLPRRLAQHNGLVAGGAKYTRTRRPVTLLAHAPCADKSTALKAEYRVRTKSRGQKISFVQHLRAHGTEPV